MLFPTHWRSLHQVLTNTRAKLVVIDPIMQFLERSASVMKNLDESTVKLNRTMTETQELLRGFSQGQGTFQRAINDPALYNNLNEAACMLVHILPRLDRMMKDLEVFADKVARHPESLGIGGAVRPSSGLKEVPPSGYWPHH